MAIDPKKDPARRCRPFQTWPNPDRVAWEAAMDKGDVLEPGGGGADWAPLSRRKIAGGYGRWITWLDMTGCSTPTRSPPCGSPLNGCAITPGTFGLSMPYTVLARVQELCQAIRVMAPERDWAWLRSIETGCATPRFPSVAREPGSCRPRPCLPSASS